MSKRLQVQRRLEVLKEIGGIMGAMKNLALMETHKLTRFLAHQHRVLAGIEAAAADFLGHYPEVAYCLPASAAAVTVAIGSQRGFCGDFNESLARALRRHWQQSGGQDSRVLVVGRRLAAKLDGDPRIAAVFDAPGVTEEVEPVLARVMEALGDMLARADGVPAISVFAHRDGEEQVSERPILPAPAPAGASPRRPYPPLLNLPPPEFFAQLARHYLWAQMHDVFFGSLMAENRCRLRHLEGAMQRMDEKSRDLLRRCNLLRQEEITEEIEVIMLSNEALRKSLRSGVGT